MESRQLPGIGIVLMILALFAVAPAACQELEAGPAQASEGHRNPEHEAHLHHFGGFLGGSTYSDSNRTALTMGLEYARMLARKWAVAAYLELVSSELERDIILAVGAIYYALPHLGIVLAPGVERAEKTVEEHGHLEQENEFEGLLRVGAGYGFPLAPSATLGPAVFVDLAGNRTTFVFGLGFTAGF